MAASCPPGSRRVKAYTRAAPARRRRKKRARTSSSTSGPYWTCATSSGRTCGTKHRTITAAAKHRRKLDRASRRAGRGAPWEVVKRGARG